MTQICVSKSKSGKTEMGTEIIKNIIKKQFFYFTLQSKKILNYKNKIIGSITIGILGIMFSLFFIIGYNTADAQQPQQQNITSTTINSTLGEDFKDCFLDIKTNSGLSGINVNKWIMTLCYETYKGEGTFNHQLSREQKIDIDRKIFQLQNSSDLKKILKAFQY